jgi:K+-transporting ATPase ATPase C chain
MWKQNIRPAVLMLLVLTVLTGIVYPLAVTLIAVVAFPDQALGSLLERQGTVVGAALIGQANDDPRYFWPRPSAVDYMAGSTPERLGSSGASNLAPTSATWAARVQERTVRLRASSGLAPDTPVPPDMVQASGSGLDPDISPAAARLQIGRVAAARGLEPARVAELVERQVQPRQFGLLGEPRVNVVQLNLALDRLQ